MSFLKELVLFSIIFLLMILPTPCLAQINAPCSLCHTMHNSQQGEPLAYTIDSSGEKSVSNEPLKNLLRTDCLGCHSYTGSDTIVNLGSATIPVVFNATEPTYPPDGSTSSALAGGNFHWVVTDGEAYGHNVSGLSVQDTRFSSLLAPGGIDHGSECTACHGSLVTPQSGCEGCHVPFHHAQTPDTTVVGQDQGWYRFLGSVMLKDVQDGPPEEGVVGIESPDWEQNPLPTQHNVYQGKTGPFTSYLESGALDQKCVGCHGLFHNETVAGSTWIRHPVSVAIPDEGEFVSFSTYNPMIPLARQNVTIADSNFTNIKRGSDLVSCISCHRPHGSPYPAMMRWGYRDWPGEDAHTLQPAYNGCAVCHTTKG